MKNAKLAALLLLLAPAPLLRAQSLQDAIKLTESERYANASTAFKAIIARDPNNGDNYFYAGENYFKSGENDSALVMYKKGAAVQPTNPLPTIGIGKVKQYSGATDEAMRDFVTAKSLLTTQDKSLPAQKLAVGYMKIADAFINAPFKNLDEALKMLDAAEKKDPTNPEIHLLRGDYWLEKDATNGSMAIKSYDKAASLDPKSCKAQLRIGQLWVRAKNYNDGIAAFQKALDIDSTFAPAWRAKGEVLLLAKRGDAASRCYKKYLDLNPEVGARMRYGWALWIAKDYKECQVQAEMVRSQDSSQIQLWRLLSFVYAENKDGNKALYSSDKYFAMTPSKPNWKVTSSDYEYRGKAYSILGKDSLGVLELDKAYNLDTTRKELLFDMAFAYIKMKKYDKAIVTVERKINSGVNVNSNDYNIQGRAYFFGPKDYAKADSAFTKITVLQPSSPTGWFWKGRCEAALDPEVDGKIKGLAKPSFEKHVEVCASAVDKNKKDLIESYSYLGYYHFLNKNYACCKFYFQEVQKLDPENAKAKAALTDKAVVPVTAADPATCK